MHLQVLSERHEQGTITTFILMRKQISSILPLMYMSKDFYCCEIHKVLKNPYYQSEKLRLFLEHTITKIFVKIVVVLNVLAIPS